jgi:hypothetical protein
MSKKQRIELNMLNFVLNAPAGTRFFYGESEAKPSWLVEELVDQLYKLGYVHKEQNSCATGLNHYYIVRTLKPLDKIF